MSTNLIKSMERGYSISLQNENLVSDKWGTRFCRKLNKADDIKRIEQVAAHLLQNPNADFIKAFLKLHAKRGVGENFLKLKDYHHWCRWEFDPKLFFSHHEFAKFLLTTPLGSQMKIFKDSITMQDFVPGVNVEGTWYNVEMLKSRFEVKHSNSFRQDFIWDKKGQCVYTFLNNGKGLQKHHPHLETKLTPFATLSDEEYEQTLEVAKTFQREGPNESRNFVLQIVSSYENAGKSNLSKETNNPRHPWIRMICGDENPDLGTEKGDVFDFGFWGFWQGKYLSFPNKMGKGVFRFGDVYNYKQCDERIVTNIAVTKEEAHKLYDYIIGYYNAQRELGEEVAFNFFHHNCTSFVDQALSYVGLDVSAKVGISEVLYRMAPSWIQAIADCFVKVQNGVKVTCRKVAQCLPNCLVEVARKVNALFWRIVDAVMGFFWGVILTLLGGFNGPSGRRFQSDPNRRESFSPPMRDPTNFLTTRKHVFPLPSELQRWQRKQPSTRIYKRPVKASIIPERNA